MLQVHLGYEWLEGRKIWYFFCSIGADGSWLVDRCHFFFSLVLVVGIIGLVCSCRLLEGKQSLGGEDL